MTPKRHLRWLPIVLFLLAGAAAPADPGPGPEQIASGLGFPEGTVFVDGTLTFVDYQASSVLRQVDGAVATVWQQPGCGANGLLPVPEGLWVACYTGQSFVLVGSDGKTIRTIDRDIAGKPFDSPSDLAADRTGGAWLTASGSGPATGKVYHMTARGQATMVANDLRFANGVAVSADGKLLYVSESKAHRLSMFTIEAGFGLGARRTFVDLDAVVPHQGRRGVVPDSIRSDRDGNVFVALYEGGGIAVFRPNGTLLGTVSVPFAHHTSLAIAPDRASLIATAVDDLPGGGYRGALYRVGNPAWAGVQ